MIASSSIALKKATKLSEEQIKQNRQNFDVVRCKIDEPSE
jgi:hypothetical protein